MQGVEPVGNRGEGGTRPPTGVKGDDLSLDRADRDDNPLAGAIHGCASQLRSSRSGGASGARSAGSGADVMIDRLLHG
jgi:hypothetical protein